MLPEKVSVTATMSVVRTGAQHMSAVACLKEVTCIVEAERKLIGFPTLQGERGQKGDAGTTDYNDLINKPTLGTMSAVNDAPSDGSEYVRKNGNWHVSSGGGGGGTVYWGDIEGTLSAQDDLQDALDEKANTADLGDLADHDTVDYQTEVTNKPTLGALASKNTADYVTDVTNKPTLGALASQDSIDYTSNYLTNKPALGTMASINDASSDNKTYGRKNGTWVEVTGGGSGSTDWGDIGGTLSDQTDLQDALDTKSDIILLAEEFDPTKTYYTENWCTKDGKLYQFRVQHTGAWDPNRVDERIAVEYLWNKYVQCAPIGSPTFLGTPTAPTPTAGDSSTKIATTAFVQGELSIHDDFKISGSVSSGGYTLTDSRIDSEHWEVDWIIFATPANVRSEVNWSTDITNNTLTLSATYAGATNVTVNMHYVQ